MWARMLSGNFAEMTTSTPFRVLSNVADLLNGTEGFTSPPKEGVLRIFSPLKNPTASVGFEGQHATPRPPKPRKTIVAMEKQQCVLCALLSHVVYQQYKNFEC